MACKCYHADKNFLGEIGVCWGTKEREPCSCRGDEAKCDFYDYVRERVKKPITNADKYFRNATDEELAERLLRMDTICRGAMDGKMPCKNDQYGISCKDCWLDWLKREVESDA